MEFAFEERVRSYIKQRIPRLRSRKIRNDAISALGLAFALGLFAFSEAQLPICALIAITVYFGREAVACGIDLHIDLLVNQKHDLDRDLFLDLEGFHTPD